MKIKLKRLGNSNYKYGDWEITDTTIYWRLYKPAIGSGIPSEIYYFHSLKDVRDFLQKRNDYSVAKSKGQKLKHKVERVFFKNKNISNKKLLDFMEKNNGI
jgi:hypothetical protein